MRLVKYKGEFIQIQMSVLTPFFYLQQFNAEFEDDLLKYIIDKDKTIGQKLVWSMSKTADFDLIDFEQWILLFENQETNWLEISEEIERYFANYEIKTKNHESSKPGRYYHKKVVATALKMGFSFESLKYVLPSDLVHILGEEEVKATQEDIDFLLA